MPPKLKADDLGLPTAPGDYQWEGATVTVDHLHIEQWSKEPDAAFNAVLCTRAGDSQLRFVLGARTH